MAIGYNFDTGKLDLKGSGGSGYTPPSPVSYAASSCTGSNNTKNRTLTITEASGLSRAKVVVDNQTLHPTTDYTISSNIITFKNIITNSMRITIWDYDEI